MVEWCTLFLLVITAPVQVVMRVFSRLLDKWGFWNGLPGDVKLLVWSLLAVGASLGAYYGGRALGCTDWPELAAVLYIAANAIWAIWYNGEQHAKREKA
jgi:hypothetical protein